jgi:hypothetical protein
MSCSFRHGVGDLWATIGGSYKKTNTIFHRILSATSDQPRVAHHPSAAGHRAAICLIVLIDEAHTRTCTSSENVLRCIATGEIIDSKAKSGQADPSVGSCAEWVLLPRYCIEAPANEQSMLTAR